jgi:hypothetical protein
MDEVGDMLFLSNSDSGYVEAKVQTSVKNNVREQICVPVENQHLFITKYLKHFLAIIQPLDGHRKCDIYMTDEKEFSLVSYNSSKSRFYSISLSCILPSSVVKTDVF